MGPDADSRASAQRIYMPLICPDSQSDSEAYFRVIETEPIISVTQAFSFCNQQKSIHKEKFGSLLKRLPSAPRWPFRRPCFPIFRRSSGRKKQEILRHSLPAAAENLPGGSSHGKPVFSHRFANRFYFSYTAESACRYFTVTATLALTPLVPRT